MKKLVLVSAMLLATAAHAEVVTWYGPGFHGKKTANGERYNQNALTCASNKHKFGTRLKVTNVKNGKSVICRVNDRGGFSKYGISLDLSRAAFAQIAPLSQGRARVTITHANQEQAVIAKADKPMPQETQAVDTAQATPLPNIEPLTISQTITILTPSETPQNKE